MLIGTFGSGSTRRSPKVPVGHVLAGAVEQPDREIGEHPAVDDHVLMVRQLVRDPDGLEEDRDRHAHPHRQRHLDRVGVESQLTRVAWKDEQLPRGDVGGDHLEPRPVLRILPPRAEVGERPDALRGQQPAHPLEGSIALEDARLEQDVQRLPDQRDAVDPARVLELAEVEPEDDLTDLRGRVPGGDQRRGDRTGGRARDVLRLEAALVQHAVRAGEPDPLDPATLAHEIDVVIVRICHGHDLRRLSWTRRTAAALDCHQIVSYTQVARQGAARARRASSFR
jgi:hypothetical protein